jgi:pyruvate dehydrogenase E1 component beta subunit
VTNLRYLQAMTKAIGDEMRRDPSVIVLGEDVEQAARGVMRGLHAEFGQDRVKDTPISEAGFVGFATGAAMVGKRPVVEFQINTMPFQAFDQLVNQAAKMHLMTGGQVSVPVTYVIPASGAAMGNAGQHSDHVYPYLAHAGIKTVIPAAADDAYGLLTSAIRDDDPVAFFAPAMIQGRRADVPDQPFVVPLGEGRTWREGSACTVVAVGHLVGLAVTAADELATEGIDVEVWDPRSVLPFDYAGLFRSVRKTGRLVVFDDSNRSSGFAAEVAATAAEELFDSLRAPIVRVTRADVPISYSLPLEAWALPNAERLVAAIRRVVGRVEKPVLDDRVRA